MMISPAPRRYFSARLVLSRASSLQPSVIRSSTAAQFTVRRNRSSSASAAASDIASLRGWPGGWVGRPALPSPCPAFPGPAAAKPEGGKGAAGEAGPFAGRQRPLATVLAQAAPVLGSLSSSLMTEWWRGPMRMGLARNQVRACPCRRSTEGDPDIARPARPIVRDLGHLEVAAETQLKEDRHRVGERSPRTSCACRRRPGPLGSPLASPVLSAFALAPQGEVNLPGHGPRFSRRGADGDAAYGCGSAPITDRPERNAQYRRLRWRQCGR